MRLVKVLTILFFIRFAFVHATATDAKVGDEGDRQCNSLVRVSTKSSSPFSDCERRLLFYIMKMP